MVDSERLDCQKPADFLCHLQLWSGTQYADFALSFLNRHYVLHGLGHGRYYRALNCNRLFLFFDLFAEIVALEQGPYDPFVPSGVPEIDRRREYYQRLSAQAPAIRSHLNVEALMVHEASDIEEGLLLARTSELSRRRRSDRSGAGIEPICRRHGPAVMATDQ